MDFDAIVIGSGFGGAVAACRLTQAGFRVMILERGRRYTPGTFPRDFSRLIGGGWIYRDAQGLFDLKPVSPDLFALQAAGWGGGSLVYANTIIRPPADTFAGWPGGLSLESLAPYYDLADYMLDAKPCDETNPLGVPEKTRAFERAAGRLGRGAQLFRPRLAVDFGAPDVPHDNRFGFPQRGCTHCGECAAGCNVGAKNTLDHNYLALAERGGAKARTRCEAMSIEPLGNPDGSDGYRVAYRDRAVDTDGAFTTRYVFICGGAINSTELLLRSRDIYKTLDRLSPRLGTRYSGNGDLLGFAFRTAEEIDSTRGPAITTALLYDRREKDHHDFFLVEDGAVPAPIARLLGLLDPSRAWLRDRGDLLWNDLHEAIRGSAWKELGHNLLGGATPDKRFAIFLIMGRERADGVIGLAPIIERALVTWDVSNKLPLAMTQARLVEDLAKAMDGQPVVNPLWHRLHQPLTCHNLGGCPMSDHPDDGVTSPIGEVHGYRNLFVTDGAILPGSVGINPVATITAVAERCLERIIRRERRDPTWRAPERQWAPRVEEPMFRVQVPAGGVAPPRAAAAGVTYTERLAGFGLLGPSASGGSGDARDFAVVERAAEDEGARWEAQLTLTVPDLDRFLADPDHAANAAGTLHVAGLTPDGGARVTSGVFNQFTQTGEPRALRVLYALPFLGRDGKPYLLDGYKALKDDPGIDGFRDVTTLYALVREGHDRRGEVVGRGVLRVSLGDFFAQLTSLRVTGARDAAEKLTTLRRFGRLLLGALWDVYGLARTGASS